MNSAFKILAITFSLILLLSATVQSVSAAAWVEHKFLMQLPDGKTKELKGAKVHIFHKQHEAGGQGGFNNVCYYPEKPAVNENSEWASDVKESMENDDKDYHCATPSSCTIIDYGAPYLPIDFNDERDIYEQGNASYRSFYGKTFSQALSEDAPFAYLANKYVKGNIRGFDGAKWQGTVDYTAGDSKGPVAFATQDEINTLNNNQFWGANMPHFQSRQQWQEGEVFKDPQGGNVLHGRITWLLKAPAAPPPIAKPTATLAGKCAAATPGIPSYTYTLTNIDLKGQQFASTHLHLKIPKAGMSAALINEMKTFLGPAIYEDGNTFDYSLIFHTTAPANGSVVLQVVSGTEKVGNQASNTKTVEDFIKWLDQKRAASAPVPANFEIATNLESQDANGGNKVLNSYISTTFRPKLTNNECGTPPTGGGGAMCLSLDMQDFGGNTIRDYSTLKPGQQVKFSCGRVTGVTEYEFRVAKFDAQNNPVGTPTPLLKDTAGSSISTPFTIPTEGGKFLAQCRICPNGQCQEWEPLMYTPRPNTGVGTPTPIPTATPFVNPPCNAPNTCVNLSQCLPNSGKTIVSACGGAGDVCCAPAQGRTRDE